MLHSPDAHRHPIGAREIKRAFSHQMGRVSPAALPRVHSFAAPEGAVCIVSRFEAYPAARPERLLSTYHRFSALSNRASNPGTLFAFHRSKTPVRHRTESSPRSSLLHSISRLKRTPSPPMPTSVHSIETLLQIQRMAARAVHHEFANAFQMVFGHFHLRRSQDAALGYANQSLEAARLLEQIGCGVQCRESPSSANQILRPCERAFSPIFNALALDLEFEIPPPSDEHFRLPFPAWPMTSVLFCLLISALKAVVAAGRVGSARRVAVRLISFAGERGFVFGKEGHRLRPQGTASRANGDDPARPGSPPALDTSREIVEALGGHIALAAQAESHPKVRISFST